jgi:hypothetical protein
MANEGRPDHIFDTEMWRQAGDWSRSARVNILVPAVGKRPSAAVQAIFDSPWKWSFDCSQFVQVVTYYAWLKVLGAKRFDERVKECGGGISIIPFEGAEFTRPVRKYRRDQRDHWMREIMDSGPQQRLTVREIVDGAPVGSRVMFRNSHPDAEGTAFRNENAVKVADRKYLAYPNSEVLTEDEVIEYVYQEMPHKDSASLAEAKRYVWIKEVDYFIDPDLYKRSLRRRNMIRALRSMQMLRVR